MAAGSHPKDLTPPLAFKLLGEPGSINEQRQSPLFGKLPAELRVLVWILVLTRYEDFDRPFKLGNRETRPGQAGPLRVAVDLLLACRAIYTEAFLVPFQVNPMIIFDGDKSDIPPYHRTLPLPASNYYKPLASRFWQFAQFSSVQLNVQQHNLEGSAIEKASRAVGTLGRHRGQVVRGFASGYAAFHYPNETAMGSTQENNNPDGPLSEADRICIGKKITHLTVRIARTDWWSWTDRPEEGAADLSKALRLEPDIHTTCHDHSAMLRGYEARKAGMEVDSGLDDFKKPRRWGQPGWGDQIALYWPDLETLELVLETFAQKQSQLETVISCAKLWQFPVERGYRLEWDGKEESTVRWQGANKYDYEYQSPWVDARYGHTDPEKSHNRLTRWRPRSEHVDELSLGQVFIIKTLTFRRRKVTTERPSAEA
ncbi:Uu.00g012240.m01.CDS01 [Anthostomella pinea]|uniref:Uu.00g012240.m01.CDS01 n=1 Tax=Anthostomella pinea TaxID=933095 RepID=A0AAI8VYI5_9PEZI|nr:Uu.00g012240.m01.CDS01 [Anthostomella pinea]